MKISNVLLAATSLLFWSMGAYAQLQVTTSNNANTLLSSIIGQGVTVSNVTLNCPNGAAGTFTSGGSGTNLGLPSGMMLTTGSATNASGPNDEAYESTNNGVTFYDNNLMALEPLATFDACILEFDIIPTCSTLSINYVFGSDEYMDWVGAGYNDAFGFFISGPNPGGGNYAALNIARIAGPNIPVTIDNINLNNNSSYYVDNQDGSCVGFPPFIPYHVTCTNPFYVQYNGFTVPLTASVAVVPCSTYRMKLAIADAGDGDIDSGVFFASSGINGGGLFCQGATNLSFTYTTNLTCSAPNNGTATINPTGGTPPYTYLWSNGQTTQTATGLSAGTYDVTITDNACSQITTNHTIILTTVGPTITFTKTDIPCNGGTTGSATVNISGGTAPFTIAWSNGISTATNPNLVAGTYNVTVTDNIGCLAIGSVTIAQASTLTATASNTASACGSAGTGTVSVTASGGTAPYTYLWSNGPTTQSQSNLAAGTYTVTVTDAATCTYITSTTITTPNSFTLSLATTNGTCAQLNSAAINLTVTGGAAPFTYAWSNAAATEDLANIVAGTYTVTVTDGNGCVEISAATVTVPTPTTATIANTPVSCFGGSDGTATATPTGGVAPYTYLWSNAAVTSGITGLTAGTYNVTVTSAEGCTVALSTTVTEPTALTASITATNPTCPNPTGGDVNATPAGGTAPYTYLWNNGPTTQSQSNLGAGTYTVIVTDSEGCTATATTALTVPSSFTLSLATTAGNCSQPNSAAIDLTVNGGAAPFTFAWSNAAATEDLANLVAGTYTVTVTDANSCVEISAATVTVPTPAAATIANTPVSCFGGNDGTATATPTGGVAPYTYLWSNAAVTDVNTGLLAGTYDVTVTTSEGCTVTLSTTVTEPTALTVTIVGNDPTCPSLNDGDATATPSGGTAPYTFLWSNGDITAAIGSLVAGTYDVTITDANGCTATASTTLANPPSVGVSVTTTDELCNNANSGTATAVVSNGTAPYSPVWSNGFNGTSPTNLAPGVYTVTVTDGNGCTATASGTVNASTLPTVNITGTDVTCNGANNGSVEAVGSFATFAWAHGALTNPSTGQAPGTYTVTVTDANGCTASASAVLTEPSALTLTLTPTQLDCNIPASGAVAASVGGGTPPYTYAWSNAGTAATISSLSPGTYTVTVTDANGCTITASETLATPNPPTLTLNVTPVDCSGPNTAAIDAVVTGGTLPITYLWSNNANTPSITSIGAGNYSITITDGTGCTAVAGANISAIPVLQTTVDTTNPSCFGAADGSIDVFGAYTTFTWSHGDLNMPSVGLGAGSYSVTVSDNNGCSAVRTFNLTEPTALQLSINATAIDCSDPNSGRLEAQASGGTPSYQYQWSNAATVAVLDGIADGTYTLTLTDANGCTATATETLIPNPALSVSLGADVSLCPGETVVFNLDTITAPITWHDGSTGTSFTASTQGTVSVTVDYPNGCQGTDAVLVNVYDEVALYAVNDTTLCETEWVQFTIGPAGFVYEWSDGTYGPEILITDSGSYTVTATSNCNVVQDTINVDVEKCNCEVFVPNAFSPNGDGTNDLFKAYAECNEVPGFRLEVFDRWGALVFVTTDFNEAWDGTMSNELCIPGVYVWQVAYVQAVNGRNYEQSKKGSVVLLK